MAKAMMMFVPSYPIADETEPIVFAEYMLTRKK
jgi:hypothetical protein